MKYINYNNESIAVASENASIVSEIPKGVYTIEFNKFTGFTLQNSDKSFFCNTEKIYGRNNERVQKVIKTYLDNEFNRNLGVLFIGNKGAGKSMCAREICRRLYEEYNIPIVIVNKSIVGIDDFIAKLHGKIIFFFDEFDKIFKAYNGDYCKEDDEIYQEKLLTLLDGTAQDFNEKKLFLATCNTVRNVSTYLLNRPGRFHYNFRFFNLTPDEIKEYLFDKLKTDEGKTEVEKHINFINNYELNYDCLKAVAYELNSGSTLKEALTYLNIINENNSTAEYDITVEFKNKYKIDSSVYIRSDDYTITVCDRKKDQYRVEIYVDGLLMDIDPNTLQLDRKHRIELFGKDGDEERGQSLEIQNPWEHIEKIVFKKASRDRMTYQLL